MADRDSLLRSLTAAIEAQESGGRSDALGALMSEGPHAGTRAMGLFQFMPQTLHGLFSDPAVRMRAKLSEAREAIPGVATKGGLEQAFLASPAFQRFAMGELLRSNMDVFRTEDPKALALAHYAPSKAVRKYLKTGALSTKPEKHGPSQADYVAQVMARMLPQEPEVDPYRDFVSRAAQSLLQDQGLP